MSKKGRIKNKLQSSYCKGLVAGIVFDLDNDPLLTVIPGNTIKKRMAWGNGFVDGLNLVKRWKNESKRPGVKKTRSS